MQARQKFAAVMAFYAVLAVLAGFTLDGLFRIVVWIFLGGIALKTWIALIKRELD